MKRKSFELNNLETIKNMVSVLKPVLADVNNKNELESCFETRPHIVFQCRGV